MACPVDPVGMGFNPQKPFIMHIDLNSCFATIEQQANPFLRGKPIAVAAYTTPGGCILAPSQEAKKMGVKTGMRVFEGKKLCPNLMVLATDVQKYRNVHLALKKILEGYSHKLTPKSIDEFVLDFKGFPAFEKGFRKTGLKIKADIKRKVGDYISVSIGVSTNRFLAKLASNLKKPDGLEVIDKKNYKKVFKKLSLKDLPGIKAANEYRLNRAGVYTVEDFAQAPVWKLKGAFESVAGYYWYSRLKGWEVDDFKSERKTVGNSYALPMTADKQTVNPVLAKLSEKTGFRLRRAGYKAKGVHLLLVFRDRKFWHMGVTLPCEIFDSRDIYKKAIYLKNKCPYDGAVREVAVSCFSLKKDEKTQLQLFSDVLLSQKLTKSLDKVNKRWGNFSVGMARYMPAKELVPERIAFGGVKEIEETVFG